MTGADVVRVARTWIGTPFHHNTNIKGVGCDCIGLVTGTRIDLGMIDADLSKVPGAAKFLHYLKTPDGFSIKLACDTFLCEIAEADLRAGDVVLFAIRKSPCHIGIVGDSRHGNTIIHASNARSTVPPRVIETQLVFSRALRFVAGYRFPGIA